MSENPVVPALLPASVQDIAGVVGLDAALAFCRAYPGVRVKIPKGAREGRIKARLREIMGSDSADKFMAHYGGEEIPVPNLKAARQAEQRRKRDREIALRYDAGESASALATIYELTERQVRTILNRPVQY